MFEALLRVRLVDGPVPAIISALALIALVGLLARTPRKRKRITLLAGVAGAVAGSVLGWLLWNQLQTFTGTSGLGDRVLLAISLAGLGMLAVIISDSRVRRRWIGVVVASSVVLAAGAAGVNIQTNQFPAVGSGESVEEVTRWARPIGKFEALYAQLDADVFWQSRQ